eukprot:6455470-Pyramimonas_sp.AAC.1
MFKAWLGSVDLERRGEPPAKRITRHQTELGGVFCALWAAYTQGIRPPGTREPKSDPRLRSDATINKFLDDWKHCGYDAYVMDRKYNFRIDWAAARAEYMRRTRPDGTGKGNHQQSSWHDLATSSWDAWDNWQSDWSAGWHDDRRQSGGK